MKRRPAVAPPAPAWLSSIKRWQIILAFCVAALSLVGIAFGAAGTFERHYGLIATFFGFARERTVVEAFDDMRMWQLYSDIVRTKQRIKTASQRGATPEELEDLETQFANYDREYDRLLRKRESRDR